MRSFLIQSSRAVMASPARHNAGRDHPFAVASLCMTYRLKPIVWYHQQQQSEKDSSRRSSVTNIVPSSRKGKEGETWVSRNMGGAYIHGVVLLFLVSSAHLHLFP